MSGSWMGQLWPNDCERHSHSPSQIRQLLSNNLKRAPRFRVYMGGIRSKLTVFHTFVSSGVGTRFVHGRHFFRCTAFSYEACVYKLSSHYSSKAFRYWTDLIIFINKYFIPLQNAAHKNLFFSLFGGEVSAYSWALHETNTSKHLSLRDWFGYRINCFFYTAIFMRRLDSQRYEFLNSSDGSHSSQWGVHNEGLWWVTNSCSSKKRYFTGEK